MCVETQVLPLCLMESRPCEPAIVRKQVYLATTFLDTQANKQPLGHDHGVKLPQHYRKALQFCQVWLQLAQGWMLLSCTYYFGACSLSTGQNRTYSAVHASPSNSCWKSKSTCHTSSQSSSDPITTLTSTVMMTKVRTAVSHYRPPL